MSDKYGMFERLLDSAVRNLANAFYDDFVEINTKFRARAGLKQIVIRRELWKCCDWCAALAGTYEYGSEPKDVWRRHLNCRCMVTTKTEKGTYQDAWSRREYNTQRQARIARENRILSEQNDMRKRRIDMQEFMQYSNSPVDVRQLMHIYDEDVAAGWISPLCEFDNYLELYLQIEHTIIGTNTSNGIIITGQSRHFIQRVIGTMQDPETGRKRTGVSITDIKQALRAGIPREPKMNKSGNISQLFQGYACEVSVNPNTGNLIQCNLR